MEKSFLTYNGNSCDKISSDLVLTTEEQGKRGLTKYAAKQMDYLIVELQIAPIWSVELIKWTECRYYEAVLMKWPVGVIIHTHTL